MPIAAAEPNRAVLAIANAGATVDSTRRGRGVGSVPAASQNATEPTNSTSAANEIAFAAASAAGGGPERPRSTTSPAPAGALPSGLSTEKTYEPFQVCPSTCESVRQTTV